MDHSCWNTITTFTSQASLTDPNGTTLDLHNWNFGDPASGVNNTLTLCKPHSQLHPTGQLCGHFDRNHEPRVCNHHCDPGKRTADYTADYGE